MTAEQQHAAREFDRMWAQLHPIGRHAETGGYRRYAWTSEDHTLREWFSGECAARGLEVTEDRAGNQWAWWGNPDTRPGDGVVIGSHLDSVPDGGAYDGPLGVVSALATVDALRAADVEPTRPLAVVNFGDEEGARFGVACAGSRLITGALSGERALGLTDADGITLAQALTKAGRSHDLGPDQETLRRIGSFVELHVEQGRALADLDPANPGNSAIAVGADIWPHGRWSIDLPGTANHAGTTRLEDRDDAMLKAAEVILAVREAAARHGSVATVGRISVEPNGINAIASRVVASLDARGSDEAAVLATVAEVREVVARLGGALHEQSWTASTPFEPTLSNRLRDALGGEVPVLGTGAGHDAGILAQAGIPSAMLFVRNPTGVSHSPQEFAEVSDCHAGVQALTTVVKDLLG
ncbi:allantoate amidohydrolase [Dermacoccaceae bacterium W4C1]